MRVVLRSVAVSLGVALLLAAPAGAAPAHDPVRLWSLHKFEQGTGEVPVQSGGQVRMRPKLDA